jgi:hypothetical protein
MMLSADIAVEQGDARRKSRESSGCLATPASRFKR